MTWASLTKDAKIAAIRDGVARKLTASKIGDELGCSLGAISGFARRNNIGLLSREEGYRNRRSRAAPRMDEVVALHLQGMKPKQIAFRANMSLSAVYSHLSNAKALDRAWEARRGT